MPRVKVAIALTAFLATGGAAAFWFAGALPVANPATQTTAVPSLQPVSPKMIRAVGYIEPVSEIRKLTFKVDGVIESCKVQIGQTVEAGEILATLRNHDEKAAVIVAEKELLVAQAERDKLLSGVHPQQIEAGERRIAKLQERLRHAQIQYDRQSGLFEHKAGTQEAFDQAKTDLQQAKEDLLESQADLNRLKAHVRDEDKALAAARVELAEANVTVAKERLRNTTLSAPMQGTALEIFKREGEPVRAFDPQPVFIFADISQLHVRAEVDERYTSQVCIGQPATIYGRSLGDKRFGGKVVLLKNLMGNKTIFSREATERKDLDVLQVFIKPIESLSVPVGLQVDVEIDLASQP